MGAKIAICVISAGLIKSQTAFALMRMIRDFPCEYDLFFKEGSIIHWNREMVAGLALEKGCTHVLFVDSDMFFEADAVSRLLARDKDIVGVHYHLRKSPPTSTVHMDIEKKKNVVRDNPDGFLTCDAVGTGFVLIKTDVFKKLSHPWFFWESDEKGEVLTGEDYWFCRKAREAGFEVWCDLTIEMKHIGDYLY